MRAIALLGAVTMAIGLVGCGGKNQIKLSPDQLAPETANVLKTAPRGLIGDTENSSHSFETLRGDGTAQQ